MTELTGSTDPESIRNALDEDEQREYLNSVTGAWYTVENGELKQVGGEDDKEANKAA